MRININNNNSSAIKQKKIFYSIILIIKNDGEKLKKTINCLLAQTYSSYQFQIIIANTATNDSIIRIAEKFTKEHPQTIRFVNVESKNLNHARNVGLQHAIGDYVFFIAENCSIDKKLLSNVSFFLNKYEKKIGIVCVPTYTSDGTCTINRSKDIFKKNIVFNIMGKKKFPLYKISHAFVKFELAKHVSFDSRLNSNDITKFLYQIATIESDIGLCGDSNVSVDLNNNFDLFFDDSPENNPDNFLPKLQYFLLDLLENETKKVGYTPSFLESLAIHELSFFIKLLKRPLFLDKNQFQLFILNITKVLRHINSQEILMEKSFTFQQKLWLLKKKLGTIKAIEFGNDIGITFDGQNPYYLFSEISISLDLFELKNDKAIIECSIPFIEGIENEILPAICVNGQFHKGEFVGKREYYSFMHEINGDKIDYRIIIPLDKTTIDSTFYLISGNKTIKASKIITTKYFPVQQKYEKSYFVTNNWRLTLNNFNLNLKKISTFEHIKSEVSFLKELLIKKNRPPIFFRCTYYLLKILKRKPIWICSDRLEQADDNGEVFFEYIQTKHKKIKCFFELKRQSHDYGRLKQMGSILEPGSIKDKICLLLADCLISSHAEFITNNHLYRTSSYNDILHKTKKVFLQHGITKDDISEWLRRKHQNFSGFVSATTKEFEAFIKGKYGYTSREFWLTGFPRYDKLYNNPQKIITFMPTWRYYLTQNTTGINSIRTLSNHFYDSSYLKFYRELFNNKELILSAQKLGYKLAILPHPQIQYYIDKFNPDPVFLLYGHDIIKNYRDVFAESSLIATDYSSAIFDFAFLKKPIIYTQFDKKEFFTNHTYSQGYFDYERDGFGEVEYDLQSTIKKIVEYMENDCTLKEKYKKRIDDFFTFQDKNNCQRVFEKINNL